MRMKCLTCGGIYNPITPEGIDYFHACPPVTHATAVDAQGKETVVPASALGAQLVRVLRPDGSVVTIPANTIALGDQRLGDVAIDRPDKRDENVIPAGDRKGLPTSIGKGVQQVGP